MLLLDGHDVRRLLDYPSCIRAVEDAFRRFGRGETEPPAVCAIPAVDGGFHVKAAILEQNHCYFASKTNANFAFNPKRHGLPTIQGVVVLFDGSCGRPLALLESGEVTVRRTAAASAVAARHLARRTSTTLTVCGCGVQGRAHVEALSSVLPITTVYAHDVDRATADRFAAELTAALGIDVIAVNDPGDRSRSSDICVTCTPSREYVLGADDVSAGAFVAGVGVDHPEKRELAPDLLTRGRLVVDMLEQCATMGDLHHALAAGVMTRSSIHAQLGDVIAGTKPGRTSDDELFVFDSTGTALQDVAVAALVYERAVRIGCGIEFSLAHRPTTD
jgi:ornithine cyclodeaminase/alanine dehydrogenase-like protein (mu-crystallin family)